MLSFNKIISTKQFIVRKKPQENMYFRGNMKLPHSRDVNKFNSPKVN